MPAPQPSIPITVDRERMQMPQHDYYTRPGSRSSPGSTPISSPPRVQERPSPKGSVMSSTSIHITVEPPVRSIVTLVMTVPLINSYSLVLSLAGLGLPTHRMAY